jgi:hypothetical protein
VHQQFKVDDPSDDSVFSNYQQSQLGTIIILAKDLAAHHNNVEAVSLHPGAIATRFGLFEQIKVFLFLLTSGVRCCKSAKQGAATPVTCVTLPSERDRFQNGHSILIVKSIQSRGAYRVVVSTTTSRSWFFATRVTTAFQKNDRVEHTIMFIHRHVKIE